MKLATTTFRKMRSLLRHLAETLAPTTLARYRAYKATIRCEGSFLYSSGWMRSLMEQRPVSSNGESLPWMNYSVTRFLETRLTQDLVLFEYGSGYSTNFFASRVNRVTSVEYDRAWFERINEISRENTEILFREVGDDGAYCRSIREQEINYDVVIIDGRNRVSCFKEAIPALTPRGVILLDDSDRSRYSEIFELAAAEGFRFLRFSGIKPLAVSISKATLFYRDGNCLSI